MLIVLYSEDHTITGAQTFPQDSKAPHIKADISPDDIKPLIGRSTLMEDEEGRLCLPDINEELQRIADEDAAVESAAQQEAERQHRQRDRDAALASLTYDFGDGRVIQTRPQDEANIQRAIELMESESLPTINWIMADNTKAPVTPNELKTALRAGRLAGLAIWDGYEP